MFIWFELKNFAGIEIDKNISDNGCLKAFVQS